MAEKNLGYTETFKILNRELEMLGTAFLWVHAHYALKRAFFFSILKCPNYFNLPFKVKMDPQKDFYWIRWGNGIKVVYPGLKLMMHAYHREMWRHPFFRILTTRKVITRVGYEKTFPMMNATLSMVRRSFTKKKKKKAVQPVSTIKKRMARRNNIWAKMTGAAYVAYKPALVFRSKFKKERRGYRGDRIKPYSQFLKFRSYKLHNRK